MRDAWLGKSEERLTVFVVVTHLGFGAGSCVTGSVYGLFNNLLVLVVEGARSRSVDGGLAHVAGGLGRGIVAGSVDGSLVDVDALGVSGSGAAGCVDGGLVDVNALGVGGASEVAVNSGAGYLLVTVAGLEAGAVFTFSNVDDRAVRTVRVIKFDARLGVGGLRSERLVGLATGLGYFLFSFSSLSLWWSAPSLSLGQPGTH